MIPGLVVVLKDPYSTVRMQAAAVESLGKIGDGRAVEPLVVALKDKDPTVRQAAGAALRSLNWQPADNMHRALLAVASHNWMEAALLGSAAVEPLLAAPKDKDPIVRRAAAEALGQIGEPAVKPLLTALQDANPNLRQAAVEPLVVAFQNKDPIVRRAVAEALGQTRDARAVEPLVAALQDANPIVRRAVAEALGLIGEPAVKPLVAASRTSSVPPAPLSGVELFLKAAAKTREYFARDKLNRFGRLPDLINYWFLDSLSKLQTEMLRPEDFTRLTAEILDIPTGCATRWNSEVKWLENIPHDSPTFDSGRGVTDSSPE